MEVRRPDLGAMKHIGVDIGRANTGVTIYDSILKTVRSMTIELPIHKMRSKALFNPHSYRLSEARNTFISFVCNHVDIDMLGHQGEKCIAIVEDYAYGDKKITVEEFRKMDKMSLELAEVYGVIKEALFAMEIPIVMISPSQLKYFVTGNGRCEKTAIIKEMFRIYKASLSDDHQYDALALCHIGRYFTLFCQNQKAIPEGSYEYNVVTKLAYDEKYSPIAKMFGLNL